MPASKATTVEQYLKELPAERRAVISTVRNMVLRNLPKGYAERMNWGMISYEIPLERFQHTYNNQSLLYIGLAAQKNYYVLHMMCVYMNPELLNILKDAFKMHGKKLDMGKACVRFKKLEDLPLDAIGALVARVTPEAYIEKYEAIKGKR